MVIKTEKLPHERNAELKRPLVLARSMVPLAVFLAQEVTKFY
jgi:hypothetical protein